MRLPRLTRRNLWWGVAGRRNEGSLKEDKALFYLFDGLQVLFRGDFHQLPLVGDRGLYHTCIEQEASNTRNWSKGMYAGFE
jgi:hypothetical protein